jgi:hypothetical protein
MTGFLPAGVIPKIVWSGPALPGYGAEAQTNGRETGRRDSAPANEGGRQVAGEARSLARKAAGATE